MIAFPLVVLLFQGQSTLPLPRATPVVTLPAKVQQLLDECQEAESDLGQANQAFLRTLEKLRSYQFTGNLDEARAAQHAFLMTASQLEEISQFLEEGSRALLANAEQLRKDIPSQVHVLRKEIAKIRTALLGVTIPENVD
jgi:hypothetical protein